MEAFRAAPFEVQVALFPRLAANVAALDRMMGPVGTPGAAANAASAATAATADAERRHCKLLEEVRCGNADQANLLLRQTARQLAQGFCLLSVAPLSGAPAPAPAVAAAGRAPSAVVPPVLGPDNTSDNDDSDYEADSDNNNDSEESSDDNGVEDDEV
jgi:hypothetical protein